MVPKHIVIVGGGFGGVYAMFSIRRHMHKIPYTLTIISDKEYFAFTPFLSEVVGEIIPARDAGTSMYDLVKSRNETFVLGTVEKLDLENRVVSVHNQEPLSYDYLVIALGATTNFLHIPGAMEHTYVLKDVDDAARLKLRIDDILAKAASTDNLQERAGLLTFAVVGGGATSIEVVGDIQEHIEDVIKMQYSQLKVEDAHVMLVTGGSEIAKDFEPELRERAAELLKKENIELLLNSRVKEVQEGSLFLTNGNSVFAHTIIWAAGVKANSLSVVPTSVIDHDSQKFIVDAYLRLPDYQNVFAIGDIATAREDKERLPMLAQAAVSEGLKVGENIKRTEQQRALLPFSYHSKGALAVLGRGEGIATVFGVDVSGKLAWFLWKVIYLFKYIDTRKKLEILFYWLAELVH